MNMLESPHGHKYKAYMTVTVDQDVIDKLDRIRGKLSRSRIVEKFLDEGLEWELSDSRK